MTNENYVRETITQANGDGIALDIGANFGCYTNLLAERFAFVYAFEPLPSNLEQLRSNIKHPNIEVVDKAIGIIDGETKLFTCSNPGGNSISERVAERETWGHNKKTFVTVDCVTLDTFCRDKNIQFIKCDIEGAEDFIFNHGTKTLWNNDIDIILEVHQTVDCQKLYEFFEGVGYGAKDEHGQPTKTFKNDHHYHLNKRFK